MTEAELRSALRDSIASCRIISPRLEQLAADERLAMPLNADTLIALSDDDTARLHGFLRLFEQLHQITERRLFRAILVLSGEDADLSTRNMVDRLEKFGAVSDSKVWRQIGVVRNRLAHDYPSDFAAFAAAVNEAFGAHTSLLAATREATDFIERERLLDDPGT